MVKMKVGRYELTNITRVVVARKAIGPDTKLFVDANGAYSRKEALAFAQRCNETDAGVTWFEEPVTSDDVDGLRWVRDRTPAGMDVAAGEYGYDSFSFRRMLDAVDVLQVDATRCGGITGFLDAAALCVGQPVPLSAHTAPSLHGHLCCCAGPAVHVEYFHDHARIESILFDGALAPIGGDLRPDRTRPGLGLELRHADAQRYLRWRSG
jgi:L-alanine-DL-glutamate epimerase-like enolase superfamily enzyme